MPSITFWNRLEPRPRSDDIRAQLAAPVRDALWMLTRQWQFGEFHAEDSGSPAWVTVSSTSMPFVAYRPGKGAVAPLTGAAPIEELIQTEEVTPDLALRVELGQTFEAFLHDAGATTAMIGAFRTSYPLTASAESADEEGRRFQAVVQGRAVDGVGVYQAARQSLPQLPPAPAVPGGQRTAVLTALQQLVAWVAEVHGSLGTGDAPAWNPERLEYAADLFAAAPEGPLQITAVPDRSAEFDWYSLDLAGPATQTIPAGQPVSSSFSIVPANVRFPGIPNARWWDFENARIDFGAVTAGRSDLVKMLVLDFALVHGNDWFVIPFEQAVGSLCRIDSLVVRDVFGEDTHVLRADAGALPAGQRWTVFSTAHAGGLADFFVLPPSAAALTQRSAAFEDVRFGRDEMADMVWAVERVVEGALGQPLPGQERDAVLRAAESTQVPPGSALVYTIQTSVPDNWIPFLPVVIDPVEAQIALERASMLRSGGQGPPQPVLPVGRILRPTSLNNQPYRVREEEVTRVPVRVQRLFSRTRWTDGSTRVWIARPKGASPRERSSGLRFDVAATG